MRLFSATNRQLLSVILVTTFGCGPGPGNDRAKAVPAQVSFAALYGAARLGNEAQRQAALQALKNQTFTQLYAEALPVTSNAPMAIDQINLVATRDRLLAALPGLRAKERRYGTIGAYWQAHGFDPLAELPEATVEAALAAVAGAGHQRLGLFDPAVLVPVATCLCVSGFVADIFCRSHRGGRPNPAIPQHPQAPQVPADQPPPAQGMDRTPREECAFEEMNGSTVFGYLRPAPSPARSGIGTVNAAGLAAIGNEAD